MRADLDSVPLDPADDAMLRYADKLTRTPGDMCAEDVQRLRDAGFDDEGIGGIAITAARYALINRITEGLGLQLPRGMDREAERLGVAGTIRPQSST